MAVLNRSIASQHLETAQNGHAMIKIALILIFKNLIKCLRKFKGRLKTLNHPYRREKEFPDRSVVSFVLMITSLKNQKLEKV